MTLKKRIIVLASGSGSNMQAIIDYTKTEEVSFEIIALIVNNPDAYAIKRAENEKISSYIINHRDFKSRDDFENEINAKLLELKCDLVVCAGFMRILTPSFVEKWAGRIINIHPSLLPKYKGLHTHQRAIDANDEFGGCTVHFVNSGVDEGAIIGQAKIKINASDDANILAKHVLILEHKLYPLCIEYVASGRAVLNYGKCEIDGINKIINI